MRRQARSLLVVAVVVAVLAGAFSARRAWIGGGDDGDDVPASSRAPDAIDRDAELAALASAEAGRLQRFPGIRVAKRGEGVVVGKVALFVPGAGEKPLEGVTLDLAASIDGREVRASAESSADGTFTIGPVRALAGYVLRATHEPHRDLVIGGLAVAEGRVLDVGAIVFGAPTSLSGTVVDAVGRPIGHALVSVEHDRVTGGRIDLFRALRDLAEAPGPLASTHTQPDGSFTAKGLPPGRYTVRVERNGYAAAFVAGVFVTVDGDSAGVRVVLEKGAGFTGRVLDPTGAPVADATVVALPIRTERVSAYERHQVRTTTDGRYRLDTLADETTYFVEATAPGRAPYGRIAPTHGVSTLDFSLVDAGRVEGRITDERTGSGLAGAEVLLVTGLVGSGTAPASVVADGAGRYVFDHALPGPLLLLDARAPGHARGTVGFDAKAPRTVRAGETLVVDVALAPGGTIRGTVRGENGRPLAFVSIAAWIPSSPIDGESAVLTDAQGAYALAGLRRETWALSVSAPGWASPADDAEATVVIGDGVPEVVRDFVLRVGGTLSGRITTAAGASVPGARVAVRARDERRHGARVRDLAAVADANGAYRIVGVPPALDVLVEAVPTTGVRTRTDAFRMTSGEAKTLDVVLAPGSKIVGRVVDAAGRPVAAARVRYGHVEPEDVGRLSNSFRADDFLGPRTFLCDAAGGFACDEAPPGHAILRVDADGFAPWFRRDLTVPAEGDLTGVVATLEGSKTIAGRIVASDTGKPILGAWVFAVAHGVQGASPDGGRVDPLVSSETAADGTYTLRGLPPGSVDVGVSVALGYRNAWTDPATARRDAVPAGSSGVDFRLVAEADPPR